MAPIVAPVDRAGTGALTVEILDSVSSSECSFPYAGSRQTALPSEGTAARGASILFAPADPRAWPSGNRTRARPWAASERPEAVRMST